MWLTKRNSMLLLLILLSGLSASACRRDMQDEPRFEAYEENPFYNDSIASRPLVDGTVPRGFLQADAALYNGTRSAPSSTSRVVAQTTGSEVPNTQSISGQTVTAHGISGESAGNEVTAFPIPIDLKTVNRGEERFNIYCSPCHGLT